MGQFLKLRYQNWVQKDFMLLKKFILNFVLVILYEIGLVGVIVVVSNYMAKYEWLAGSPAFVRGLPFMVAVFLFALPILWLTVGPHIFPVPRWIRMLAENGQVAPAVVLGNEVLKGVGGYRGADIWVTLPVEVTPAGATPFSSQLHCRLSRSLSLRPQQAIIIRYDPTRPQRVIEQP